MIRAFEEILKLEQENLRLKDKVRELEGFYDPTNMGLTHLRMKRYFEAKEEK